MLKSEYKLGHVWGIPIKIHISLLVLLVFMASRWGMAGMESGGFRGGLQSVLQVLLLELLVFGSIALHELGHSFVAIRKGCRVHEITLMFIGGAAKMDRMPSKPRDECLMAIAGPAVSLLLGGLGMAISIPLMYQFHGYWPARLGSVVFYAGLVNLILAGFNLIPAFPMDGGRVFRALMTPRHGRLKATYFASRLGRALAVAFLIIGLFGLEHVRIFGLVLFRPGNLILIMISGFIFITANREYRMVQVEELMKQRGFGGAWPGGMPPPPPPDRDDETVHISPPPYAKGPDAHTELHQTETQRSDNPFSRLFRR
jgi:Zn-dependent protease